MVRRLTEVEPETKVKVTKIEGSMESNLKATLQDLGILEGVELTLLASEPIHAHVGPISLKVADKEAIVSQGWADKIFVEKEGVTLPLLKLEKGDKGTVKSIEGGKDFENWVSELGIKEGSEVEFLAHIPHGTLVFKVGDTIIKMGQGRASKIWVEVEGKTIQINYLEEGKRAKVSKVIGGVRDEQEMIKAGIKAGAEVTLMGREPSELIPEKRGNYVLARIGDRMVTIGRGMAEKVWVD